MDFSIRAEGAPSKLAILPGAFNPPTRAHLAMAEAALTVVDEVLFTLPRVFPHKEYSGAGFDLRVRMLQAALAKHPRFSLGAAGAGLFIDIAHEVRQYYSGAAELYFLCGRDAAERIVNWDYGPTDSIEKQLEFFKLLVVSRGGHYEPPPHIREKVLSIALAAGFEEISSTEVRRRIKSGEPWRDFVPDAVAPIIEKQLNLW
jgi:nicotinate-nucleotide adenylyltransferase